MRIRDRIREFRRIPAREILPNSKNWRVHSKEQSAVVGGLLAEVGFTGVLLVRETRNGYELIDGHLRLSELPEGFEVPCLVLDVNDREADYILATHDAIGDMAGTNQAKLDELLSGLSPQNNAITGLLNSLKTKPLPPPPPIPAETGQKETSQAPQTPGKPKERGPDPAKTGQEPSMGVPTPDSGQPPDFSNVDAGDSGEFSDDQDDADDGDVLEIENSGEKYHRVETVRFRGWSLPTTPEVAELLHQKILAHYNQLGTVMGLGEKLVAAIKVP